MKKIILLVMIVLPSIAFAGTIVGFVTRISNTIDILVPAASLLVTAVFFYGLARFIFNSDDEKKRAEGKGILMWSVLAMFVFITIYGIVGFMQETLGSNTGPDESQSFIILPTLVTG